MPASASAKCFARLVEPHEIEALDVMGPTIELLTAPGADDDAPCVMRGTIPPGVFVPLHAHSDPETFVVLSGEFEGLAERGESLAWIRIRPGDVFHVPGGAKHAFRNRGRVPAVMIVVATARLGRFFREVGTPAAAAGRRTGPPSGEVVRRFLETARRYGHWSATPEENAAIGLRLLSAFGASAIWAA